MFVVPKAWWRSASATDSAVSCHRRQGPGQFLAESPAFSSAPRRAGGPAMAEGERRDAAGAPDSAVAPLIIAEARPRRRLPGLICGGRPLLIRIGREWPGIDWARRNPPMYCAPELPGSANGHPYRSVVDVASGRRTQGRAA